MKAITVEPRQPNSARLEDIEEPDLRDGCVPPEEFSSALQREPDDIKVVVQFSPA